MTRYTEPIPGQFHLCCDECAMGDQCAECGRVEGLVRRDERRRMRTGILAALGLKTRHESVNIDDY